MRSGDRVGERKVLELLRELSHELRTPLGVALNVVKDGAIGRELEQQDFVDAHSALSRIRDTLEELKPLLQLKFGETRPASRDELMLLLEDEEVELSPLFSGYSGVDLEALLQFIRSAEVSAQIEEDGTFLIRSPLTKLEKLVVEVALYLLGLQKSSISQV